MGHISFLRQFYQANLDAAKAYCTLCSEESRLSPFEAVNYEGSVWSKADTV